MSAPQNDLPLLRLTEHASPTPGRYTVEITLEHDGPRKRTNSTFDLPITPQDAEDLRKYQESHLEPDVIARIEQRMADLGEALFRGIFHSTPDATRLWHRVSDRLADTRVEIIPAVPHAASVPWELLRDPETSVPVALEARAFVRAHPSPVKLARSVAPAAGPIRILLVISRPLNGPSNPFRSVAARILRGLDQTGRGLVTLDVLRPPTFDRLARTLRDAKDRREPYHVVHCDGHGTYAAADATGYLVFESPDEAGAERRRLIDGPTIGKLLHETGVPILVLNACRSAHAAPPPEPALAEPADLHDDVESFGSLALAVMDKGVSGVVAMRYNVYVATAARFIDDLYRSLATGLPLGEAVTRGRKQLHDQPLRILGGAPRKLQDWPVPVVYEAEPLTLFPPPPASRAIKLTTKAGPERGTTTGVPPAPDLGFCGRDVEILILDRAFDRHRIVLIHGPEGIGKTSLAAELARWYAATGGIDGPVLWTRFSARRLILRDVLGSLASCFERDIEQVGTPWVALSEEEQRGIAIQILAQRDVLWIWDAVDAALSTDEERRDLIVFLRQARDTKARILLTSRGDEQAWMGELPARVPVPPMPWQERVELARAVADKRGVRLDSVWDWKPLLLCTKGSPREITEQVGRALREGVRTKEQVEAFVKKLEASALPAG